MKYIVFVFTFLMAHIEGLFEQIQPNMNEAKIVELIGFNLHAGISIGAGKKP